jgi:quercetin dioxygenase-like cupin family protein
MPTPLVPPRVLLRSQQTEGRVSVVESTMPAGAKGPPLRAHEFDEAFYVLEGEPTVQVRQELRKVSAGELAFALGSMPHTLANRSAASARFLIICTPVGLRARVRPAYRRPSRRRAASMGNAAHPRGDSGRTPDWRAREGRLESQTRSCLDLPQMPPRPLRAAIPTSMRICCRCRLSRDRLCSGLEKRHKEQPGAG